MAKATAVRNVRDDHQKAFLKIFNSLCGRFNRWQVWQDFVMVTAIEISNATDKQNAPERTKTYQTIISKYSQTCHRLNRPHRLLKIFRNAFWWSSRIFRTAVAFAIGYSSVSSSAESSAGSSSVSSCGVSCLVSCWESL